MSNRTKGFGLLDILLAIAVSAIVVILAISYYSNTETTQKINRTIQQLEQIHSAVQNQLQENSAKANPTTFSSGTNLTSQLISEQAVDTSTVTSVWDNSLMQINVVSGSVANKGGVTVGHKNINLSSSVVCLRLNITICGVPSGAVNKLSTRYMASFVESSPAETSSNKCMLFSSCIG